MCANVAVPQVPPLPWESTRDIGPHHPPARGRRTLSADDTLSALRAHLSAGKASPPRSARTSWLERPRARRAATCISPMRFASLSPPGTVPPAPSAAKAGDAALSAAPAAAAAAAADTKLPPPEEPPPGPPIAPVPMATPASAARSRQSTPAPSPSPRGTAVVDVSGAELARLLEQTGPANRLRLLVLDLRSFLHYNRSHVVHAINISVPQAVVRRAGFTATSLEAHTCKCDIGTVASRVGRDVVVYDDAGVPRSPSASAGASSAASEAPNLLRLVAAKFRKEGKAARVHVCTGKSAPARTRRGAFSRRTRLTNRAARCSIGYARAPSVAAYDQFAAQYPHLVVQGTATPLRLSGPGRPLRSGRNGNDSGSGSSGSSGEENRAAGAHRSVSPHHHHSLPPKLRLPSPPTGPAAPAAAGPASLPHAVGAVGAEAERRRSIAVPADAMEYVTAEGCEPHDDGTGFPPGPPLVDVVPYVYIGDDRAAADASLLRARGITRILNVANECANYLHTDASLRYMRVNLHDSPDESVSLAVVEEACRFIDSGVAAREGVLVHCMAGRSRSATVVLAYLMTRHGMSLADAYQFLKSKRPGISPNLGYMGLLLMLRPHQ